MITSVRKTSKTKASKFSKRPTSHGVETMASSNFNVIRKKPRLSTQTKNCISQPNKQRHLIISQRNNKQNRNFNNNLIYSQNQSPINNFRPEFGPSYEYQCLPVRPRQNSENKLFTNLLKDKPSTHNDQKIHHMQYGNICSPKGNPLRHKGKPQQNKFDKFFQETKSLIRRRQSTHSKQKDQKMPTNISTNESMSIDHVNTSKNSVKFDMSPYLYS